MSETFGVGIMGAGNISGAYLKLAPLFRNLQVRAIADLQPAAAQAKADEYGIVAQTPDELLKNSEIDVVVNLTIPAAHFGVSMDIISAGKHAYSEKPFVLSLEEGAKLKTAADERDLLVGSAPDTFLGGVHQQARALIDGGEFGKIMSGTMHVMSSGMEMWHPNPEFFFQPGAGPILDIGPYYVTDLIHLLGPVRRVTSFANMAHTARVVTTPGSPVEGQAIKVNTPTTIHGILEFHSGAIVTLGASWDVKAHGHDSIELYGTEGSLFVPDPNFFGGTLESAKSAASREKIGAWDHPFGIPNQDLDSDKPKANYRAAGLADMMASIGEKRKARCGLEVALHAVDVMTSLLHSAEAGTVITLQTSCERPAALGPEAARALLK